MKKFDANSNNPLDDQGQDLSAEQVKLLWEQHEGELEEIRNGKITGALIFDNPEVPKGLNLDYSKITGIGLLKSLFFIGIIYSLLYWSITFKQEYVYDPGGNSINKNIGSDSPPTLTDGKTEGPAENTAQYLRTEKILNEHDYTANSNKFTTSHITGLDSLTSSNLILIDSFTLNEIKEENNNLSNTDFRFNSLDGALYNSDLINKKIENRIGAFDFEMKSNIHWNPFRISNLIKNGDSTSLSRINSNLRYSNKTSLSITTIKSKKGNDITLMTSYISDYLKTNMEIKKDMIVVIIMSDIYNSSRPDFNSKKIMTNNSDHIKYEPRIEKFKLGELLYRIGQSDSWKSCNSNQLKFVADKDGIIELMVNLKSNKELLKKPYFVSISSSQLSDCR